MIKKIDLHLDSFRLGEKGLISFPS